MSFRADEEAIEGLAVLGSLNLLKNSPICMTNVYSWYMQNENGGHHPMEGRQLAGMGNDEDRMQHNIFYEDGVFFKACTPDFIEWFGRHANGAAVHCFNMMVEANSGPGRSGSQGSLIERSAWDLHIMANVVGYKSKVLDIIGMHDKDLWLKREIIRVSPRSSRKRLDPDRIMETLRITESFSRNGSMLRN